MRIYSEFNLININKNNNSLIVLKNTKNITSIKLNQIKSNCYFKIEGGLFDVNYKDYYDKRVTYTLKEMKRIIDEIEKIEIHLKGNKTTKAIFIYDYLRKKIKYDPQETNDKKIRSLYSLVTKKAVCSGYALILKELLDRQNIPCKYINHNNHVWNIITIDSKKYEVDLTWDSCIYNRYKSSNLHYFGNNKDLSKDHNNYTCVKNFYHNDILNTYELNKIKLKRNDGSIFYLTLLPIGILNKYYVYEENNNKFIISTLDDIEIILSSKTKEIKDKYINDFFSKERIERKKKDNIAYLGYGYFNNNCFFKKNIFTKDFYIKKIIINNSIFIYTEVKNYKINKANNMEVFIC